MDNIQLEFHKATAESPVADFQAELRRLSELQLIVVAGGCGETVFD